MFIFLLLIFPVFIFFLIHLESNRKNWIEFITFKEHGLPFVMGMINYILAVVLISTFGSIFKETYNPVGLYFYYFANDHLIYLAALILGYILFLHFLNGRGSFLNFSLFAAGYFTIVSIITVIANYNRFDSYLLILLPLLRVSMIFVSSCLITRLLSSFGLLRVACIAGLASVPAVLGVVTYLYKNNYIFLSFIIGILLFLLSFFIMVKVKE